MSNSITLIFNEKKIKLCQNVIDTMLKYIQKGFFSKEAGGILMGKENKSNENIIINHITVPMSEDKRKYNKFIRKDKRHVEVFKNLYRTSEETLRYIGEWHTHPEAIPNFSEIVSTDFLISLLSSSKIEIHNPCISFGIFSFNTLKAFLV